MKGMTVGPGTSASATCGRVPGLDRRDDAVLGQAVASGVGGMGVKEDQP